MGTATGYKRLVLLQLLLPSLLVLLLLVGSWLCRSASCRLLPSLPCAACRVWQATLLLLRQAGRFCHAAGSLVLVPRLAVLLAACVQVLLPLTALLWLLLVLLLLLALPCPVLQLVFVQLLLLLQYHLGPIGHCSGLI